MNETAEDHLLQACRNLHGAHDELDGQVVFRERMKLGPDLRTTAEREEHISECEREVLDAALAWARNDYARLICEQAMEAE